MFVEIGDIVDKLLKYYKQVIDEWHTKTDFSYNQSVIKIKKALQDDNVMNDIFHYLIFLNNDANDIIFKASLCVDRARIKNINSLLNKVFYYVLDKKEKGDIQVNKCVNDLFGLRIITKEPINFIEFKEYICNRFPKLKCTEQNKNGYKGIHVYLKEDNFNYLWELQIWYAGDVENNMLAHSIHKQKYTKWEKQTSEEEKGGQSG